MAHWKKQLLGKYKKSIERRSFFRCKKCKKQIFSVFFANCLDLKKLRRIFKKIAQHEISHNIEIEKNLRVQKLIGEARRRRPRVVIRESDKSVAEAAAERGRLVISSKYILLRLVCLKCHKTIAVDWFDLSASEIIGCAIASFKRHRDCAISLCTDVVLKEQYG